MTATLTRWSIPDAKIIMTAKDVEQDRSAWLRLRTTGVTATDMRVLAGHGYAGESVYRCWRGKTDPDSVHEEDVPGQDEDVRMHLGTEIEPVIRKFAARHLELEIRRVGFLQSRREPLFLASPDGAASDGGGVELKMTSPGSLHEQDQFNQRTNDAGWTIPAGWWDQLQTQLMVSGWPHIWLCALVVDAYVRQFTYWKVLPDTDYQAHLRDLGRGLWRYVEQDTPPPPDFENDVEIKARWPVAEPMAVTVDYGTAMEIDRMIADRRDLSEAEKAKKVVSNRLAAIAGDAQEVRDPDGNLLYRWNNVGGSVLDQDALARDYPGLNLADYKVKVPIHHRSLWIPGVKD